MSSEGWIKIFRKFSDWEWFNISEMVHLFIYLLINANHQDGEWRGIVVKRGQILTGLNSMNKATNISFQTIRTCLKRLEKTNEINIQVTNKYSIITICKYDDYQQDQQTTNKQINKQLTSNQQTTNNKQECKEEKEIYVPEIQKEFPAQTEDFFLTKKKRQLKGKRLKTFLIFWDKYNLKKGKAEAADSWFDIPQLTDKLCEIIYKAAELEAKQRPIIESKGLTPIWAQGWITARRWEDEYITENKNKTPKEPAI